MQRLVYQPKVEAYVSLDDNERGHRTVELTDDIINGEVIRRLNAMSEATLTLQNKRGKYTGGTAQNDPRNNLGIQIKPMDRILIRLSRVGIPFLAFTGYIDEAPFYQLYPGPVTIRASCPLKLLQYTFFDPGLPYLATYFHQFGWTYNPETGLLVDNSGAFGNFDVFGGIGHVLANVLRDIGNWPENSIDILDIPISFLKQMATAMNSDLKDEQIEQEKILGYLKQLFGIDAASPDSSDSNPVSGNVPAAKVARYAMNSGFKGDKAVIAVAIAMAESSLKSDNFNYNQNKTFDLGLWQINTVHSGISGPYGVGAFDYPPFPDALKSYRAQMFDPQKNADQAWSISSGGTSFSPWVTYSTGAYKDYLDKARKAVGLANTGAFIPDSSSTPTDSTSRQNTNTGETIATKVVQVAIAESKKNIREQGGQNRGPEIKKYQDYVGIPQGPSSPWCAAFVSWCFGQAGDKNIKTAGVSQLDGVGKIVANPRPGDIVSWSSQHTGIVTLVSGNSFSGVAGNEGDGVRSFGPYTIGTPSHGQGVPHFVNPDGIGNPAADAGVAGGDSISRQEVAGIARQAAWFTLQLQNNDTVLSNALTGVRALANDIPLMQWISNMTQASARVFTTKPDGTFFAFFPDRFGYFENTPYFRVSDIELLDFTVQRNDTNLTTHVFGSGSYFGIGTGVSQFDKLNSAVASVESAAFPYFINIDTDDPRRPQKGKFDYLSFLQKYGARPFSFDMPEVRHPALMWMGSWMKFVELWAKQYQANASMTFLPELLPGGLVEIGGRITMFVEDVTHSFDREAGFTTQATLSSPAAVNTSKFTGLPNSTLRLPPGQNEYIDPSQFSKDLPNK